MTIYENNKQLLTTIGGNADNYYSTDFEVRKAILDALGGNSSMCSNIYEVDLQILKIFQEGGGAGGDITLTPITITENGVYTAGVGNGYNKVTVNVSSGGELTSKVKVNVLRVHDDSIVNGYWPAENFDTINMTDMSFIFQLCRSLQTLDVSDWNTSNVKYMTSMFISCSSLQSLDVSYFDTSNVKNTECMFSGCSSLQTLGDLSNWDTSNVTDMYGMFSGCTSLQTLDVSNFDTSKVTNMYVMFNSCSSLQTLDVSNFDTSNVTSMREMFGGCSSLQSLDLSNFDTSKVTGIGMTGMFNGCSSLQTVGDLSNWDTSNVTDMDVMFNGCSSLQTVDVSNFDASNVTEIGYMFRGCNKLTTLIGGRTIDEVISNNISALNGLKVNIYFQDAILDRASLRAIINGLADLTGSTSQRLSLSSTLIRKVTEEDIAIATEKNWTITQY